MLPLLSDEDVPGAIVDALRQLFPGIDVVRVQDIGLMRTPDPIILDRAASEDRAIFTRDRNTMTSHARDRLQRGVRMAGLIVLAEDISIGKAAQELGTLAQAGDPGDLDGQILFLS
jgi:predicted nuclease of predicted toxin-antitoxin system